MKTDFLELNHGSLFSGIGGFDLAADWVGWNNAFHCEWNVYGQRVLKHHDPKAKTYEDITKTDFTIWRGRIDVLTGGFPCQPYSTAGKRKGTEDERHLWPEMLGAIRQIQPRWVVGENVLGITNWNGGMVFEEVQTDLENEGYEVFAYVLPAAGVNAPHQRYRTWFVAYSNQYNDSGRPERHESKSKEKRVQKRHSVRKPSQSNNSRRFVTNAYHTGTRQQVRSNGNRKAKNKKRSGQSWLKYRKARYNGATSNAKRSGKPWQLFYRPRKGKFRRQSVATSTNANGQGRRARIQRQSNYVRKRAICKNEQNNRNEVWSKFRNGSGNRVIAYANGRRQPRKEYRKKKSRRFTEKSSIDHWKNFPTQPPVRSGNDGLSTESLRQRIRADSMGLLSEEEIDSILSKATSKWVKETIKAGGNAVVPPLVVNIFNSINAYEKKLFNKQV